MSRQPNKPSLPPYELRAPNEISPENIPKHLALNMLCAQENKKKEHRLKDTSVHTNTTINKIVIKWIIHPKTKELSFPNPDVYDFL